MYLFIPGITSCKLSRGGVCRITGAVRPRFGRGAK
jgi:hypothetical protein